MSDLIKRLNQMQRPGAESDLTVMCAEAAAEITRLRAEVDEHKATIKAMTLWLEVNQRDVWKRGLWEAIDAARAALKEPTP